MKKTLIITGPETAREINELGDLCPIVPAPTFDLMAIKEREELWIKREKWKNRQSSLKEYRIHGVYLKNSLPDRLTRWNRLHVSTVEKLYPIGSTHKFEVSEETLTAIIL